jgi:hypothetical protein
MPTSRRRPSSPRPDEQLTAALIEIGLRKVERFLDAQPGSPQDRDQPAQRPAVGVVTGGAHDGDDLPDLGRVGRIAETLVARRSTGMEPGHRRGRSTSTGAVEQPLRHKRIGRTIARASTRQSHATARGSP